MESVITKYDHYRHGLLAEVVATMLSVAGSLTYAPALGKRALAIRKAVEKLLADSRKHEDEIDKMRDVVIKIEDDIYAEEERQYEAEQAEIRAKQICKPPTVGKTVYPPYTDTAKPEPKPEDAIAANEAALRELHNGFDAEAALAAERLRAQQENAAQLGFRDPLY